VAPRLKGVIGTAERPPNQEQSRGQPSCFRAPRHDVDRVDQAILSLLLFEPGLGPWAIDELVREIGSRIGVDDSLWRLHRTGVIHRLGDGFVFASRAAAHAAALLDPESQRASWTRGSSE
jgi:hypothetical protein